MNKEKIVQNTELGINERFFYYYITNKKTVYAYASGAIILVIFAIMYLTSSADMQESIQAKTALEEWKKKPSDQRLTQEMHRALKKVPGLNQSVQAEIAQILLTNGQLKHAENIATSCINRLKEDAPWHASFSQASLLIENKQYQKALEASVALKEKIDASMKTDQLDAIQAGSALYVWNLLRIAFLQKELHNHPGELSAWEELKALVQASGASAGKLLQVNFGQRNFSLSDFISQRERSITHSID